MPHNPLPLPSLTNRNLAIELAQLERRLRAITELRKLPAYARAEFVEIEDRLIQLSNALHEMANQWSDTNRPS